MVVSQTTAGVEPKRPRRRTASWSTSREMTKRWNGEYFGGLDGAGMGDNPKVPQRLSLTPWGLETVPFWLRTSSRLR